MLRFSIIVPSLNQARYLEDCLASIWKQSVDGLEVIVVDGASTDGTPQILEHHAARMRWLSEPDGGPADAFNKGLQRTDGDVIGWLNADDLYAPTALTRVRRFLADQPEVDVVYGAIRHIDSQGEELRTIKARDWSIDALNSNCFLQLPSVFFRRRVLDRCGELNPRLKYWADFEFWLRLADAGFHFARLSDVLGSCRFHPESRRWGAHDHRVSSLIEWNDLIYARNGRLSSRRILQYAHAEAQREGVSRECSVHFDRTVLRHAREGVKRWSRGPGLRMSTREQVAIVARHTMKELEFLVRHPNAGIRFLPQPIRGFLQTHLRRKLFKLRVYDPRPVRFPAYYQQPTRLLDPPTISVVTPNLNQGAYLEQTIRSVVDQQYAGLEYIIQDGGSTDNSVEIIKRYANQLARWDSSPDRGQSHAINRGMEQTTGSIMAFLNSDDLLLPGSLAYVADYFQRHPEADVVYGHRLLIDEAGNEIGRWVLPPHDDRVLPWADYIPQETMFWRRSAWERVGGQLDESFHFALDWDLILRFRAAGLRFVRLPRFLGAFRVTEQQKTSQLVQTVGLREMARLRKRVLGREPSAREIRRVVRPYLRRHMLCETLYTLGLARY